MITATFQKKNNQFVSYSVSGHANYAPHGQDIVCAAVSALYTTITNCLIEKYDASVDKTEVVQVGIVKESQDMINLLYKGLLDIGEQYPDNIKVLDAKDVIDANEIASGTLNLQGVKTGSPIMSVDQIEHLRQKLI